LDDLALAMESVVTKMTISKYENCQIWPSSSVLISLSKALDQPVDYFFRPFSFEIKAIKFRKTKSRLSTKQEKAIKESISDLVERYQNVEEICNDTVLFSCFVSNPVKDVADARNAALEVRNRWGIGEDGIVNVINLLEENGVKILEIDAPDSFDGLCSIVNEIYPVIVLNKAFPSERKRFTAMHELGHLLLSFSSSITAAEEEKLCNCFASEMLIPESSFKREFGNTRRTVSYQELRSMQIRYGISCDALMYKAKECGVISPRVYSSFCIRKNQHPEFKQMVERSFYPEEESLRFVRLVYKALSNEFISISKAASLLHQSVEQVRSESGLI
ncbi:MAG: ImmA/IrrE family metallo-endopeptidase, partial [Spirochaetales bacterium]|nr:ImmA/IrrE family metallo-endopeptidase [Candidatus Physcosoma equi]